MKNTHTQWSEKECLKETLETLSPSSLSLQGKKKTYINKTCTKIEPLWSKLHSKATLSAQQNKSKNKSIVTRIISNNTDKKTTKPKKTTHHFQDTEY